MFQPCTCEIEKQLRKMNNEEENTNPNIDSRCKGCKRNNPLNIQKDTQIFFYFIFILFVIVFVHLKVKAIDEYYSTQSNLLLCGEVVCEED